MNSVLHGVSGGGFAPPLSHHESRIAVTDLPPPGRRDRLPFRTRAEAAECSVTPEEQRSLYGASQSEAMISDALENADGLAGLRVCGRWLSAGPGASRTHAWEGCLDGQ
ncbi:hypothetical protein Sfulv_46690 [Streptomyces fulvorobeus]|uniref:Uncharacterized protein n=1 Tax=Streptomyces fulvorobeus TaxID=284028 RepID=A0A7J0CBS5_9ACTN|nr:hypothetical protein Sfulv_46690 [Streptomyces fulvorobeus]